ncbi:hypothetical protein V1260_13685 [Brachybacterium sp. J144]|uniref:hypothetical protein n=1 Tax=Brachybacterium sp. J144 TaxID=3116487 RepID=UPI002E7A845B|nr:hypothetical protein [Brachybacterium sp. J144]MEE1651829.1 hypothetical protein [Brachybacterium sp. J144]
MLIEDEVKALLHARGNPRLGPEAVIMLAALLFADDEGVARIERGELRRWCAGDGQGRAGSHEVWEHLERLMDMGALAPGSRTTELRLMFGRAAGAEVGEVAA